MRLIKVFGLALVAAIASMALIGASSALATSTVICTKNVLVCPEANQVVLKEIHLLATDPTLVSSFGTVLCEFGLIKGEVLHLASPLQVHLKELKYINCKLGKNACTEVKTTHLGLPHLLKTGPNLGEVLDLAVDLGAGAQFTTVHVVCSGLDCEYKGESLVGHAVGTQGTEAEPKAGSIKYSGNAVKVAGGFLCPKESTLSATYVDLHIPELYISE